MQVFNAQTQQMEDVVWSVDAATELVATFADGHFYKFPNDITIEDLQTQVDKIRSDNEGQQVITPEMEQAKTDNEERLQALADELNQENAPQSSQDHNADETSTDTPA